METLGQIGRGAQTAGKGALTGLAMAAALRRGGDPLAILVERQLQEQQLANAQQAGLLQRAQGLQDPATRALLVGQPGQAGAFGLETVPQGIAAPDVLTRAQATGAPLGGQVPILPGEVETVESLRRRQLSGQATWYDFLRSLAGGGGAAQPAGAPGAAGPAPGGAPATPPMRLQSIGPSGPTFGPTPTKAVDAGTINPSTGKPFVSGEALPSGETAIVKPPAGAAAMRGQLTRITAARTALRTFTTKLNIETGMPDPKGTTPIETLPSGKGLGGGLIATAQSVLPSAISGIPTQISARRGNAAAAALIAGSGQRANLVKAFGDAGNLNQQEQEAAERSLLPGAGDTQELATFKAKFADQLLAQIEKAIQDGYRGTPDPNRPGDDEISAAYRELVLGAVPPTPEGAGGSPTPGGTTTTTLPPQGATFGSPESVEAARARVQALGGLGAGGARLPRRALGGSLHPGQVGLVGENGPELATGPLRIQPLQDPGMQRARGDFGNLSVQEQGAVPLSPKARGDLGNLNMLEQGSRAPTSGAFQIAGSTVDLRKDLAAQARNAAKQAVDTTRRLKTGATASPLQATGGGAFEPAAARRLAPPSGAAVQVPTSAPLTAEQMGGALNNPNVRIEVGPDGVVRRVPVQ